MKIITNSEIATILQAARTIAVVGASGKPSRDSYSIMNFLLNHGYTVIPVNPNYKLVLGLQCYPSLLEVREEVDIVNIFRRPDEVLPVIDEAIRIKAKTVWMQLGVFNETAGKKALNAGLNVISNRCIKVDYLSLIGS